MELVCSFSFTLIKYIEYAFTFLYRNVLFNDKVDSLVSLYWSYLQFVFQHRKISLRTTSYGSVASLPPNGTGNGLPRGRVDLSVLR